MAADYEVRHREGGFAELVGFEKKILTGGATRDDKIPDITRSVDLVFLHRDLITRQATDVASDVLFSLSTVNFQISYPFQ